MSLPNAGDTFGAQILVLKSFGDVPELPHLQREKKNSGSGKKGVLLWDGDLARRGLGCGVPLLLELQVGEAPLEPKKGSGWGYSVSWLSLLPDGAGNGTGLEIQSGKIIGKRRISPQR